MARARNIKPGFFTDAELIECPHWVRLLFAGLWTIADREGRLLDKPKQIGVDLFPREALDIDAGLNELAAHGLIVRFEVDGLRLIQVASFTRHQNPHRDEKASILPPLPFNDEHGASTVQAPDEHGGNRADSGFLVTDSGLLDTGVQGGFGADAPPRPKTKSATAMTDAWQPGDTALEALRAEGFLATDIARELVKFRDHFQASGKPMKDWDAAWRNWMRRSREFAPARASPRNGQPPEQRRPSVPRFDDFRHRYEEGSGG